MRRNGCLADWVGIEAREAQRRFGKFPQVVSRESVYDVIALGIGSLEDPRTRDRPPFLPTESDHGSSKSRLLQLFEKKGRDGVTGHRPRRLG